MSSELTPSGLQAAAQLAARLRELGRGARSMEQVARRIVRCLYENIVDRSGQPACVLVRFFKTHPLGGLEPALRDHVQRMLADQPLSANTRCLVLLATAGLLPEWNDRHQSRRHKVIPLPDPKAVAEIPMLARLIRQFGLDAAAVVDPSQCLLVDDRLVTFNVFHVADARGSPYVPDQDDFVAPYGVRSVVGFGGTLPSGSLFAVILFSRVPIDRAVAEQFKTLALATRMAVEPFDDRVFDEQPGEAA